jgi:hypothetical protein
MYLCMSKDVAYICRAPNIWFPRLQCVVKTEDHALLWILNYLPCRVSLAPPGYLSNVDSRTEHSALWFSSLGHSAHVTLSRLCMQKIELVGHWSSSFVRCAHRNPRTFILNPSRLSDLDLFPAIGNDHFVAVLFPFTYIHVCSLEYSFNTPLQIYLHCTFCYSTCL